MRQAKVHSSAGTIAIHRRAWLRGMAGAGMGAFWPRLIQAEQTVRTGKSVILLWLGGGPSQFETWDPKPGMTNGGPTQAIATSVPGIHIAEHWPCLAMQMEQIALLRSLTSKEGSHERATYQLHTGRKPTGALKFPNIGSVVADRLGQRSAELPNFVSVGPTIGSGFLESQTEPFVVQQPGKLPENVAATVNEERLRRRLALVQGQNREFAGAGAPNLVEDQGGLYQQATRMMLSPRLKAFQLEDEPAALKDRYGTSRVGQGLLVARRLIEQEVPFVEIQHNGWDHHRDVFNQLPRMADPADQGLSALLEDLGERGLLERTLVVVLGEFGRTPKINPNGGRDHWPQTFGALLAGAGIRGGQAIGATNADGTEVETRPLLVEDLFQTICRSVGLDPDLELIAPNGRPLKIVDGGTPISELLG